MIHKESSLLIFLFYIIIILLTILIVMIICYEKNLKTYNEEHFMPSTTDYRLIQENSVMIISNPNLPIRSYVLGSLGARIIQCESSSSHYNKDGTIKRGKAGEIGIAQFKRETFYWMSDLAGFSGNVYNEQDQIWLLEWGLKSGYKNHWSCYKKVN